MRTFVLRRSVFSGPVLPSEAPTITMSSSSYSPGNRVSIIRAPGAGLRVGCFLPFGLVRLLLDLPTPNIFAAFEGISGTASGGGVTIPCDMSTECRRELSFPLVLARLSRVDIDRESGGVLAKTLESLGVAFDEDSFGVRSILSVLSWVEPRDEVFSSLSPDDDVVVVRFFLELDDSFSAFDFDEDFFSSPRGVADHMPHDEPSRDIFGRSFFEEDFGSGGGGGASGTAGGGMGAGGGTGRADEPAFLLFLLDFLSVGISTIATISSSSSSGKLPGRPDL